jgi:tRNA G10  N-methylase Trm11
MSNDLLIVQADARRIPLADAVVQCVVTSPPYWGLRKYAGAQDLIWPAPLGAQPWPAPNDRDPIEPSLCRAHEWGEPTVSTQRQRNGAAAA